MYLVIHGGYVIVSEVSHDRTMFRANACLLHKRTRGSTRQNQFKKKKNYSRKRKIVHYDTSAMKRFLTSVSLQHEPSASDVITLTVNLAMPHTFSKSDSNSRVESVEFMVDLTIDQ